MPNKEVSRDVRLWRYLTAEKLTWLLDNKRLYLPLSSKFEDPWEGRLPRDESREYQTGLVRELRAKGLLSDLAETDIEQALAKVNSADLSFDRIRYVSCWHMNEGESAAMWDLYCSREAGIAITTSGLTLNDLADSIEGAVFEKVEYLDYERDSVLKAERDPALCKRRSFSHENEARLVLLPSFEAVDAEYFAPKAGLTVNIEPSTFIEEVYLAPTVSSDFAERIRAHLKTAQVECNVRQSDLYTPY